MGVDGQRHPPAAFTPGKDPVPIVQEAGWAPEPVWTGAENLAQTGIRSPDLPARSESLYRLSYRGSHLNYTVSKLRIKNFTGKEAQKVICALKKSVAVPEEQHETEACSTSFSNELLYRIWSNATSGLVADVASRTDRRTFVTFT